MPGFHEVPEVYMREGKKLVFFFVVSVWRLANLVLVKA